MKMSSNAEWLEGLGGNDKDDFISELFEYLLNGLHSYFGNTNQLSTADLKDFAQESILKILNKINTFRGESKFTTWAMKIAVNTTLSALRKKRWEDVSLDELIAASGELITYSTLLPDETSPEINAVRKDALAVINDIISNELTNRQRTAFQAMLAGMPRLLRIRCGRAEFGPISVSILDRPVQRSGLPPRSTTCRPRPRIRIPREAPSPRACRLCRRG